MTEVADSGLRALVEAVGPISGDSFTIRDRRFAVLEGKELVDSLAEELYHHVFTGQGAASTGRVDYLEKRRHLARLSEANCGGGAREPNWRVEGVEPDGSVAVSRDGVTFFAVPDDVSWHDGEAGPKPPQPGDSCRVRVPEEQIELQPGFYVALGDADRAAGPVAAVIRVYWHLRADTSVLWLRTLTSALNRCRVPFRLKTLSHPRYFNRSDAGVLYLHPDAVAAARDSIVHAYRRVAGGLRSQVPQLTLRLARGLALAEGPADGSSFGEHRCRLIAAALVRAFERGIEDRGGRLRQVSEAFAAAGLDPSRPYLAAGATGLSAALEGLDVELERGPAPRGSIFRGATGGPRREPCLEDARRLGDRLCEEAIWHRDRCNWIGRSLDEVDLSSGIFTPTAAALDAGLYRGAAGVGLFLAELYRRTGDDRHGRTAAGALWRALDSPDAEEADPLGFFDGRLGVAWAARRGASLLAEGSLAARAGDLLRRLSSDAEGEHLLDVYGGNAGAILALLGLHRDTDDAVFLRAAATLGEEILTAADRDGEAWWWSSRRLANIEAESMLTGFSHGAAGIGLALLELFAATGERTYLAAASGAFAYEDGLFDPIAANWPDFRSGRRVERADRPDGDRTFMTAWCHGAPGIALSRLRAMVVDPERAAPYAAAARAGLAATRSALDEGLAEPDADVSLCHGLCGLVDVLLVAAAVLGEPELRRQAVRAMSELVVQHGEHGRWPSGVPSRGSNPSLMLGDAGVGWTLLRCLDPERTPSALTAFVRT